MLDIGRPHSRFVPVSLLLSGFLLLLLLAGSADDRFATWATHAPQSFVGVESVVTDFGLSGYMFALSAGIAIAALCARTSRWGRVRRLQLTLVAERAIFFFAAIGASGILAQLVKHIVGRSRPRLLERYGPFHFEPFSWANVQASFPSGHTTTAFAAAVAFSLMFPRGRPAWFLFAVLIGASRVVVGAHYPSDVVGGAALGSGVAYGVAKIFARRGVAFDPTSPNLRIKRLGRMPGEPEARDPT